MPLQEMMTYVNTIQQCIQVLVDENRKLHALNRSLLCRVKIADQQKEEQELMQYLNVTDDNILDDMKDL